MGPELRSLPHQDPGPRLGCESPLNYWPPLPQKVQGEGRPNALPLPRGCPQRKLLAELPSVPVKADLVAASQELDVDVRVRILVPAAAETWKALLLESPYKHESTSVSLECDTHACVCSHMRTHVHSHM